MDVAALADLLPPGSSMIVMHSVSRISCEFSHDKTSRTSTSFPLRARLTGIGSMAIGATPLDADSKTSPPVIPLSMPK
jgi:hypothetical protein